MIEIRPDPAHPRGGFAELQVDGAALADEVAEVAIFDAYSGRYLGDDGWQATRHGFGPYRVDHTTPGGARVIIGPEIVNQLDEFAILRIEMGPVSAEITWPEDIMPAPGAARIEGISVASIAAETKLTAVLTAADLAPAPDGDPGPDLDAATIPEFEQEPEPEPEAEPAPAPVPHPVEPAMPEDLDPDNAPGPSGARWLLPVLLLLFAAGAAYFYMTAAPDQPKIAGGCGLDHLAANDGFAAQAEAIRACGAQVSPDTALTLLERAAANGDGTALAFFGMFYDKEANDAVIEGEIGLSFDDNPATAADYYARAIAAGAGVARDPLQKLCARMAEMSDTLVQSAYEDHCAQ